MMFLQYIGFYTVQTSQKITVFLSTAMKVDGWHAKETGEGQYDFSFLFKIVLSLPGKFTDLDIFEHAELFVRYFLILSSVSVFSCSRNERGGVADGVVSFLL